MPAKPRNIPTKTVNNHARMREGMMREQSVLRLRAEGLSHEEIGQQLGVTAAASWNLAWRAQRRPENAPLLRQLARPRRTQRPE